MAQKTNYRFERMERDRKKAAKKAERLNARQEKVAERKPSSTVSSPETSDKS